MLTGKFICMIVINEVKYSVWSLLCFTR